MDLRKFVKSYTEEIFKQGLAFRWSIVPADGSNRTFFRLSSNQGSFIVMANPPITREIGRENTSYLNIGKHLLSKGIPVPCIYRHDLDHGWFIMEDLGRVSLREAAHGEDTILPLYRKVIELLIHMQHEGRKEFDPDWCYSSKKYDKFIMKTYESNYFFEYFLTRLLGMKPGIDDLQSSFDYLADQSSRADNDYFLHRDFQSSNLIVDSDGIGVVDWQGGRLGPLQYDLASLLIDPYVEIKEDEKRLLYDHYITLLEKRSPKKSKKFIAYYPYIAIQRNLQILGAFSYLSKLEGKTKFLSFIAPALTSLKGLLEECDDVKLRPLEKLVEGISDRELELKIKCIES